MHFGDLSCSNPFNMCPRMNQWIWVFTSFQPLGHSQMFLAPHLHFQISQLRVRLRTSVRQQVFPWQATSALRPCSDVPQWVGKRACLECGLEHGNAVSLIFTANAWTCLSLVLGNLGSDLWEGLLRTASACENFTCLGRKRVGIQ